MFDRSKASIRAEFGPIIADYLNNGGRVVKFDVRGQRIA
jgi:hypothetical protein